MIPDGTYKPFSELTSDTAALANKADSVKSADGSYKPISQIVTGRTDTSSRADSVLWGGSAYKLLDDFLPDSLALFRRKAATVDSGKYAVYDSASIGKAYVDSTLSCDSVVTILVRADSVNTLVLKTSGTRVAGQISVSITGKYKVVIPGLNANCVPVACPDTAWGIAAASFDPSTEHCLWGISCKTDTLLFYQTSSVTGKFNYLIIWSAP